MSKHPPKLNFNILLESPIGLEDAPQKVNAIIEIPKGTNAKYDMSTEKAGNIIEQDKKDGRLRHVPAIYQDAYVAAANLTVQVTEVKEIKLLLSLENTIHGALNDIEIEQLYGKNFEQGYNYFHYGAITQTYENPLHSVKLKDYMNTESGSLKKEDLYILFPGDGDPLDICVLSTPDEINYQKKTLGSASTDDLELPHFGQFEILGVYAMIDDGEIDWKVLACTPEYKTTTGDEQIEIDKVMVAKWFQYYKCKYNSGSITNTDAVKISMCLPVETAIKVIGECHHAYKSIKKVQLFYTSITTPKGEGAKGGYRRKYSRNKKSNQKSRVRSKKRQQRRK